MGRLLFVTVTECWIRSRLLARNKHLLLIVQYVIYKKHYPLAQNTSNANAVQEPASSVSLQHCADRSIEYSLCNFSSTQALNKPMSDHYVPILTVYGDHF
jgi:hypothetical protein